MASIRNNFFYKTLLTISSYIIAFLTFPYISRVLGVDGVGVVNFVDNSVGYFILFASMGITILGTREIAAAKDDQALRNKVFSNLLGLNVLFTVVTLAVYFVLITIIPRFSQNVEMFYIGAAKIISTVFLVEWFFTGLENFRYITLRSLAIKLLYVAAVFLFVKEKEDYVLYFTLSVGSVVVNALINIIYARRFVRLDLKSLRFMNYIKEYVTLGLYSIMTSMYITFNVMFLGLQSDNTQVGYYTTAFKLYIILLGVFSAFTSVTMPRISAMLAQGNHKDFAQIIDKSFNGIVKFILPLIICGVILAPQIIFVISGKGFEGAILPMRIIFPAALSVGIAQILAVQILIPLKRDKVLLTASIIGAVSSLIANVILVPHLASVGSAIVTLVAETIVTMTYVVYTIHKRVVKLPFKTIITSALHAIPPAIVCIVCSQIIHNPFICIATAITIGGGIWIASNFKTLKEYFR